MKRVSRFLAVALAAVLLQSPVRSDLALRDLGVLPGDDYSAATAVNNWGQVVGWSQSSARGGQRAFIFDGNTIHDLGAPAGQPYTVAVDINDHGVAVGYSHTGSLANYELNALVWDNGTLRAIGSLPGFEYSAARAINDRGQVVGYSFNDWFAESRAFLYDIATQVFTDLGSLGGSRVEPRAINNNGQVVGTATVADGQYRAFIYDSFNGMQDIGLWAPTSINATGHVAGAYIDATGRRHAALYDGNTLTDLNLEEAPDNYANAVNTFGSVVGDTGSSAFLWADNHETNLTEVFYPNWFVNNATDINDQGQIVGNGYRLPGGETHAILLTPGQGGAGSAIPEPVFVQLGALLGLSGLGLVGLRRRT